MAFHLIDVVRYNGADTANVLAWKHPNTALKPGTILEVMPHQLAVFVKSGRVAAVYSEGRHKVEGNSAPFLTGLTKMVTGGVDPYSSMLYFINKPDQMNMLWGVGPIGVPVPGLAFGPRSSALTIPAGANGQYTIALDYENSDDPQVQANNPKHLEAFLNQFVSGHDEVSRDDVKKMVRQQINESARTIIGKVLQLMKLPIEQIDSHTSEIRAAIEQQLQVDGVLQRIEDEYGLKISDFRLNELVIDKSSKEWAQYEKRANMMENRGADAESNLYVTQKQAAGRMAMTDAKAYDQRQRGYTFQQEHTLDVLKTAAANTGSGSDLMNGGIGLGVGLGAGGVIAKGLGGAISAMGAPDFSSLVTPTMAGPAQQPGQAAGQTQPNPAQPAQPAAQQQSFAGGVNPVQSVQPVQPAGSPVAPAAEAPVNPTAAAAQPQPAQSQTQSESAVSTQPAAAAQPVQPAQPQPAGDLVQVLSKLKQLHDLGLITDEQFTAKQQEILSQL